LADFRTALRALPNQRIGRNRFDNPARPCHRRLPALAGKTSQPAQK
jgi:hypothetical protein